MRELLSWLMLTTDEAWLTHAARVRTNTTVTPQDIMMEDMLFKCEELLQSCQEQLKTSTRPPDPTSQAPVNARGTGKLSKNL